MYCRREGRLKRGGQPDARALVEGPQVYNSTHLHKRTKNATSALETWWGGGEEGVGILDFLTPTAILWWQVLDLFENAEYHHVVLELARGITLFDLVEKNGHLEEPVARSIFAQE
jgi:hypothetical protein